VSETITNTERLIASLEHTAKHGGQRLEFRVGRYTGNGSACIAALRRRGYEVIKLGTQRQYAVYPKAKND
jgi:hypothetical protein